jgi:hypothetical protein
VAGRVLLPGDDLLRMEQLAVHSVRISSTTVGSRSLNTARGTCLPTLVSEKKILNQSPLTLIGLSNRIYCLAGCHARDRVALSSCSQTGYPPTRHGSTPSPALENSEVTLTDSPQF